MQNRLNRDGTSFFTWGGWVSCLRACLGARLLPQSYQYPNLSQGADCVAGQLRGDKECPISGVTRSGRVWRKVPESDVRSVPQPKSTSWIGPRLFLIRRHRDDSVKVGMSIFL